MPVKGIVANVACAPMDAKLFYGNILGRDVVMDHGRLVTFASDCLAAAQVSFAIEGGSGTPVPDLSIEVDNLDEGHSRTVRAGFAIEFGPVSEPWRVRRFFDRDPFGRLVNILVHE